MRIIPLLTAAASFALACPAVAQVARLTTADATVMPNPSTVLIQSAHLPGDGLVAIRSVQNGKVQPGALGEAAIKAGETANVRVRLARPVRTGEALLLVLYADFGRRGVYDGDPLVLTVDIPAEVVRTALQQR
jgi:hypothetical protein